MGLIITLKVVFHAIASSLRPFEATPGKRRKTISRTLIHPGKETILNKSLVRGIIN
jgi:hypothetical protein